MPEELSGPSFISRLAPVIPAEILLWPVYVDDRLVAILYGDEGPEGHIDIAEARLRSLMDKVALSLRMLVLKNRIRGA